MAESFKLATAGLGGRAGAACLVFLAPFGAALAALGASLRLDRFSARPTGESSWIVLDAFRAATRVDTRVAATAGGEERVLSTLFLVVACRAMVFLSNNSYCSEKNE